MRFLENLFIKIFSLIVLVVSVLIILIGFDLVNIGIFEKIVKFLFSTELKSKITVITCIIFALVSIKIILTNRRKPKNGKDGLVLENSSGKLIISKESLDNLIYNAAKDIPGADNISSKTYLDLEQNLRVFVTVSITQDVSIKELSTALQTKIKTAIKQTADLEVSEVNVKIKSIVNKKNRKIKDTYVENKVEPVVQEINTTENNVIEVKEENSEEE